METKSILRKQFKKNILDFVESSDLQKINQSFFQRIEELFAALPNRPETVGLYGPLKDEVDWTNFLSIPSSQKVFPHIEAEEKTMTFHEPEEDLDAKSIGISLKLNGNQNEITPELIFVPALAFDNEGFRLGRGGGYYDRYLESFSGIKVGLIYSCSLCEDLPRSEHDIPVNYIITENKLYACSQSLEGVKI